MLMFSRRAVLAAGVMLPLTKRVARASPSPSLEPVAKGLDHPWGIAFLPSGDALITEREGRLRLLEMATRQLQQPIEGLPNIQSTGQGGLLGVAIDPAFESNRRIYLSFSEARDKGNSTSVFRAELAKDGTSLVNGSVIFRQNPSFTGRNHFGSRLVFDREGHLFVTTGDRYDLRDEAQNPANHIGKVIRITTDGKGAPGNPQLEGWAAENWSIGHRNVQGATLHPETGALWTVEHGARGGDEVNTPEPGKNYGWPIITYGRDYSGAKIGTGTEKSGMEQPLHYWDPSIAPSGMVFYSGKIYPDWQGNLFVGALAGQHIARLKVDNKTVTEADRLFQGQSRFRDIVQGPDGHLYCLTDNGSSEDALYKLVL
jgi:aldose sugar dehydrogenase